MRPFLLAFAESRRMVKYWNLELCSGPWTMFLDSHSNPSHLHSVSLGIQCLALFQTSIYLLPNQLFLSLFRQCQFFFCWLLLPILNYPHFLVCSLHLFAQFSSHSSLLLVSLLFPCFFYPSFLSSSFHPLPVAPCLCF